MLCLTIAVSSLFIFTFICDSPAQSNFSIDPETGRHFEPGKLLVSFEKGVTEPQINEMLESEGLEIKKRLMWPNNGYKIISIQVTAGEEFRLLKLLKNKTIVRNVGLNYSHK